VFSPKSWAGVIVLGVVVVLFLVSGGLPLLNWRKARRRRKVAAEDREARRRRRLRRPRPQPRVRPGRQPHGPDADRHRARPARLGRR